VVRIHCNLLRRALCQNSSSSGRTCCLHHELWHVYSPVTLQYSFTIQYSTLKKVSSSYETTQPILNTIPTNPSTKFSSISFLQGVTHNLRSLAWPIDQLFHSHQSPCVLTPIPVGTCYVLPFVPGNDGNPWTIYSLFGNSQTTTLSVGMTC